MWSGRCLRVNPWTLPGAPLSKGAVNYSLKALLGETREPWDPARCQEGLAFEDSPDWTPALSICAFAQSPSFLPCPPRRTLSSLHATCLRTPVSPSLLVLCPLPRMPFPFQPKRRLSFGLKSGPVSPQLPVTPSEWQTPALCASQAPRRDGQAGPGVQ